MHFRAFAIEKKNLSRMDLFFNYTPDWVAWKFWYRGGFLDLVEGNCVEAFSKNIKKVGGTVTGG